MLSVNLMQLLHWAQSNVSFSALILLSLVLVLRSILLNRLQNHAIPYYSAVFPGVILHELSHLLGCLITFSQIKDINLFSLKGGHVSYGRSGIPFVSAIIISIFPLLVGIAAIYFLASVLFPLNFDPSLSIQTAIVKILVLYLIISVTITMIPSFQDLKNAIFGYIVLVVILLYENSLISKLKFSLEIMNLLILCVAILVVVNLIVIVLRLIKS